MRKLTALIRPPSRTWWSLRGEGGEGKKKRGREEKLRPRKGKREDCPKKGGIRLSSLKCDGSAENAGMESATQSRMQGVEIAGVENAGGNRKDGKCESGK